jgi:RNA polymerase sigma factor (sigma-70 family)
MEACRNGDPEALRIMVERYLPHIRTAVRNRLSVRMRKRFDSLDFAQDVWVSFFRGTIDHLDLPDEQALIRFLSTMAFNKVGEELRHQTTQKVGLDRDVSLERVAEPIASHPTPSAELLAMERWEQMTEGLSERDKLFLIMLRDGHSHAAVASEFGLSEKTIQRLLSRLHVLPQNG